MSDSRVSAVYAGIAGDHIRSFNSRGVIAVSGPDNEINGHDEDRVIEAAKAVSIPIDREIVHVLPQEFVVDDQPGIKDPIGMSGVRLEADVHIVTGAVTSAQNICKSIRRAGVEVSTVFNRSGIHPEPVGALPPQLAALNRTNLNVQQLLAHAILEEDRELAIQAVMLDPLTASVMELPDIREMMEELFEADAKCLPDWLSARPATGRERS